MAEPMNPVLQALDRREVISDPAVRELYFGSNIYRDRRNSHGKPPYGEGKRQ